MSRPHIPTQQELMGIRRRLDAVPAGPWQRSRFVDHPRYRDADDEWKRACEVRERQTIREPGEVGSPGCNAVAYVEASPAVFDFLLEARDDVETLLGECERLGTAVTDLAKRLTEVAGRNHSLQDECDQLRAALDRTVGRRLSKILKKSGGKA